VVSGPTSRGGQQALWIKPFGCCGQTSVDRGRHRNRLHASTLYVLWRFATARPSQDVLAAGDVVVLDRNGTLIEDWNPAVITTST